jgi:hypothetical protein
MMTRSTNVDNIAALSANSGDLLCILLQLVEVQDIHASPAQPAHLHTQSTAKLPVLPSAYVQACNIQLTAVQQQGSSTL